MFPSSPSIPGPSNSFPHRRRWNARYVIGVYLPAVGIDPLSSVWMSVARAVFSSFAVKWCHPRLSWGDSEWQRVIFTDKSRFCLGGDDPQIYVLVLVQQYLGSSRSMEKLPPCCSPRKSVCTHARVCVYVVSVYLHHSIDFTVRRGGSGGTAPKFSDDSVIVGLITNEEDSEYRELIQDFVDWCLQNHLQINAGKTKELVVDFRRCRHPPPLVNIQGMDIERVDSYKYLGVHLNNKLDCRDVPPLRKAAELMLVVRLHFVGNGYSTMRRKQYTGVKGGKHYQARLPPPASAADEWQRITDEDTVTHSTFSRRGGGSGEGPEQLKLEGSLSLIPFCLMELQFDKVVGSPSPSRPPESKASKAIERTIILNMTHGEETGPETHQDSAVLTYLEGLLMHRVAGAQGATATQRGEAGSGSEEQRNKETTGLTFPHHSTQQEQDKTPPQGGTTQHLKKARLLRSEAWTEHENKRRLTPSVEVNGRMEEHHGGLNGSSQCKGESTLLASLLQSFSSRLQNVALSQQIVQSLMPQDPSSPVTKHDQEDKAPRHGHGSGPSHFKGMMENSTVQNPSSSEPYHHRLPSQERSSESPQALQHSARPPSTESLPCTERLKAVANLVNIRSSPAPSPKPSVACSQLALLLSSEAHLQQYSREQALKAQLAGRSASERLAAMATHQTQAKKQATTSGQPQTNQDGLSSLHTKNGIPAQMSTSSSRQTPNLSPGQSRSEGSMRRTHPFRERRPFERHGRPSQNCSSLLLQLLNSHNTPQRLNCQGHLKEEVPVFSSRGSPLFSDSEHSNSGSSLQKDSSDAESTYSSCSPIDLSVKNKVIIPTSLSSSSSPALDKVTESMKSRWTSESPITTVSTEPREVHSCPEMKPHHKVTLLELLLDHKNNEKANQGLGTPEIQPITVPKANSASTSGQSLFYAGRSKDTREPSPNCRLNARSPKLLPTFSQSRDCNARASPYTLYSPSHTQSAPLDLCKTKPTAAGVNVKETSFSASKLLQDLAQCGKQNTTTSPPPKAPLPPIKRQTQELKTSSSATLLERLSTPIQKSSTPTWGGTNVKTPVVEESAQHGSEIENLLERRTVLQLLLGNKSQKERVGHKRKRDSGKSGSTEKQPNHLKSHSDLNRPTSNISVKMEPVDDGEMYSDNKVVKQCQNTLAESPRHSSHTLYKGSIKQEPLSPVDVPRDGLLCHLLQQQPRALKPVTLEDSKKDFKEEPVDHQGPTIPKKRKILVGPEDHAKGSQQGTGRSPGSQRAKSDCSISGIPETQKSNHPSSPPEADSPPAKFPPCESPSHENRGFNVLKQLLLSDNCLKELSQSRSTFSPLTHPVLNGSTIKEPHNGGEPQSLRQCLSPGSVSAVRAGANRAESLSDVRATLQDSSRSKRDDTPHRDLKTSVRLVNGDDRTQDYQLDSPRLTKANPILYYMLQRSNAHLVRESREVEASSGQCRVQKCFAGLSVEGESSVQGGETQQREQYSSPLRGPVPTMARAVHEEVKKYYSSLETGEDLQTSAACPVPSRLATRKSAREALQQVHPDVCKRFFGCGVVIPEKLKGCSVLDLGSGSGRDCYLLSKLVGEDGHVTGIDMTEELIQASRKYIQYHQEKFGYVRPNTVFVEGYMEKLSEAGIQNSSVDVIVSNCVICLCPDKRSVLSEAYKVLKAGGELYFSDMYASQVVPDSFKEDPVLWGEGMGGALYWKDLISAVKELGFSTPRLLAASHIQVYSPELQKKTGDIKYASGTYRIFKLPQHSIQTKALVTYKGTIPDCAECFEFDASYSFKTDEAVEVDAETAAILQYSRFSSDFAVQMTDKPDPGLSSGEQSKHIQPNALQPSLWLELRLLL
ncbi:hypothetical protein NFI96_001263 [Prochilodus magdalenae]|nr:hypothetical protein NFI96_001263 [Prochilodus magdalenae]